MFLGRQRRFGGLRGAVIVFLIVVIVVVVVAHSVAVRCVLVAADAIVADRQHIGGGRFVVVAIVAIVIFAGIIVFTVTRGITGPATAVATFVQLLLQLAGDVGRIFCVFSEAHGTLGALIVRGDVG